MRIGEFRVRMLRVMQYATFVTFAASIATAVKVYALPWWVVLLGIPPFLFLYWLDGKIVRGEQSYFNENNEALQTLIRDIKDLKEKK
jgi:hypothetical protein